jgi:hypothetical protein
MPHREHQKSRLMPAQSRQIAVPPASPGSSRDWPQPGQRPRIRDARAMQVRQILPSGQVAAVATARWQRAQPAGVTAPG